MSSFPTTIVSTTDPTSGNFLNSPSHSANHAVANDEIVAIETKVGIDNSADTNSLDYKVRRRTKRIVSMADGTSITPTGDTADVNTQVNTQAGGTLTVNAPSGTPFDGQGLILRLQSTNQQTFSWNAIYRGSNMFALPTTNTGSSKTDYFGFLYNGVSSTWDMVAIMEGF
jgi:hypothetical protein